MKRDFSTKLIGVFSIVFIILSLAGSGCKGSISNPPQADTPATQTPTDQPPADQPPADQPPADQPPATQPTAAQIKVSSAQITSGDVVLNYISEQTVSIQNTGTASLNVGLIALANPLAPPFSIVNDACSGQALQPSAACSFQVRFSPTSQGAFTDNFDIPSDASNGSSLTVDVTGSGKALQAAISQVNTDNCSTTGTLELMVTVLDQNNLPLSGLGIGSFQLTENGVSQAITGVSPVLTQVPISVAMVLDYSGSMQYQIPTVEDASKLFVGLLNADDEAAIIKFAKSSQLMKDFTSYKPDLITAITTTPTIIASETHLYDALWFAMEKTAVRQKTKVIILIADGRDTGPTPGSIGSVKTPDEVIAYATGNAVAIYTVGLGDFIDSDVLSRMAGETGGQFYHIANADQLAGVYQTIRNIFMGQYSVQYVSSLHGSSNILLNIDVVAGGDEGAAILEFTGCP